MKTILLIVLLNAPAAVTAVEFDDAKACERAAEIVHKFVDARTACIPKATVDR